MIRTRLNGVGLYFCLFRFCFTFGPFGLFLRDEFIASFLFWTSNFWSNKNNYFSFVFSFKACVWLQILSDLSFKIFFCCVLSKLEMHRTKMHKKMPCSFHKNCVDERHNLSQSAWLFKRQLSKFLDVQLSIACTCACVLTPFAPNFCCLILEPTASLWKFSHTKSHSGTWNWLFAFVWCGPVWLVIGENAGSAGWIHSSDRPEQHAAVPVLCQAHFLHSKSWWLQSFLLLESTQLQMNFCKRLLSGFFQVVFGSFLGCFDLCEWFFSGSCMTGMNCNSLRLLTCQKVQSNWPIIFLRSLCCIWHSCHFFMLWAQCWGGLWQFFTASGNRPCVVFCENPNRIMSARACNKRAMPSINPSSRMNHSYWTCSKRLSSEIVDK